MVRCKCGKTFNQPVGRDLSSVGKSEGGQVHFVYDFQYLIEYNLLLRWGVAGPFLDVDIQWAPVLAGPNFFQVVNCAASSFVWNNTVAIPVEGLMEISLGLDDILALVYLQRTAVLQFAVRHLKGKDI